MSALSDAVFTARDSIDKLVARLDFAAAAFSIESEVASNSCYHTLMAIAHDLAAVEQSLGKATLPENVDERTE